MDNIIHRSFTKKLSTSAQAGDQSISDANDFHPYGLAAGYVVGLARDIDSSQKSYLKIILKSLDGGDHTVASFSDTPEGRFQADVTAMAILRSLNLI